MRIAAALTLASFFISVFHIGSEIRTANAQKTRQKKNTINVPLHIKNSNSVPRNNAIVSSGIPLPEANHITRTKKLRIVDDTGKIIPAQFQVLSRWNGGPQNKHNPIQWVLVDFQVKSLPANGEKIFRLQTAPGNHVPHNQIHIQKTADHFTINTGVAQFVLNRKQFTLFQQVKIDSDDDGTLDTELLNPDTGGAILTMNGKTYTTRNGDMQTMKFEHRGPLHSVLLVKGWHENSAGEKALAYTTRFHFYANSPAVTVQYAAWNDGKIVNEGGQPDIKEFGSPNTAIFSGITLNTQLQTHNSPSYTIGGTADERWNGTLYNEAVLYQDSSGGPKWSHTPDNVNNTFRGFTATANDTTMHDSCANDADSANCRAVGWIDLSSSAGGLAVGVRDFWQNYPKGLRVNTNGTVQVELFPEEYNANFELRVGEQKTHTISYYFHAPDISSEQIQQQMIGANSPLQAWAPANWYLNKAAVFHHAVAYNKKKFSAFEGYNNAAISYKDANLFLLEDGIPNTGWTYGDRPESYGWRNYGDRIAEDETSGDGYPVFTNMQYDHTWFYILQTIRTLGSGNSRSDDWWNLAAPAALLQGDINIIHSRCTGKTATAMGSCMDSSTPIPIGWAMGGRLTNQWHSWSSEHIHRHALIDSWAGGLHGQLYYYYLTGDGFVKDAWKEYARNSAWRMENTPCNQDITTDCDPGYASMNPHAAQDNEWGRGGAYMLEILTDAWNATGKQRYLDSAQAVVAALNPDGTWFTAPDFTLNSNAEGTGRTVSPWAVAMVTKSLGYYLDSYKDHFGTIDTNAQHDLIEYAHVLSNFWQLGEDQPTQYRIYENGAYTPVESDPLDVAMADGLIWALDYDDGTLDRVRIAKVAEAAFNAGSHPWGSYAENTYMTTKTHVMMGINGWRYMKYALNK
ncbi:MAG: hypothetical protein HYV32_06200 [Candidatus Kerfeldbacteria bacterium]|nr:hypothetical protein [Candidatus Kerfeldbacteria bacterium]